LQVRTIGKASYQLRAAEKGGLRKDAKSGALNRNLKGAGRDIEIEQR
jgi:hypothetical protein